MTIAQTKDCCPLCDCLYEDPLLPDSCHRCPPHRPSDYRGHKWYRSNPLSDTYRKIADEIVFAPKDAPDRIKNATDIEKIAKWFNKRKRIQGYKGDKSDRLWSCDDTAQECYVAFLEGYSISQRVNKAWNAFLTTGKVKKPDSNRTKHQEGDIYEYRQLQHRRANPPMVVGGKWEYFYEFDDCKRYAGSANPKAGGRGELIDVVKKRRVVDGEIKIITVPRPGGEIVSKRVEKEIFPDPDKVNLFKKATEEDFGNYDYRGLGYDWNAYHGYRANDK